MAWVAVAAAAVTTIGGSLLSDDNGAGDANAAASAASRQQAAIAQDQWDTYKRFYQPLETKFVADAQSYDSPENRERAAGLSSATTAMQFGKARQRMARAGVDTSSAAYTAGLADLEMSQAAADATGQNAARNKVEDMGWARRTDALSLGKGLPAQASAGLSMVNAQSTQAANTAFARQQNTTAGLGEIVKTGMNGVFSKKPAGLSHDYGGYGNMSGYQGNDTIPAGATDDWVVG